jgi:hypothetical protein
MVLPSSASETLRFLASLADEAAANGAADRDDPQGALHALVLAALTGSVRQARCVHAIIDAQSARGALPNVRAMFELLVTARYLADPTVPPQAADARLERYYRGVRREQVRLRDALQPYPELQKAFVVDLTHAVKEKAEYIALEQSLSKDERLGSGHWSGLPDGLRGMADVVGLGSDYAFLYKISSGMAHATRPWDDVTFDPGVALVLSNSGPDEFAGPIAFDAMRYLGWTLVMAHELGVVALYRSQQAELAPLRKYLKPLNVLFKEGLVGAGAPLATG